MGPLISMKNLGSAPSFIVISLLKLIFFHLFFRNKSGHKMSATPTPTLQEDQVARLAEEAAAAVRAAMADRNNRRPGADPASGASAKPPPPAAQFTRFPPFLRLRSVAKLLGSTANLTVQLLF
jgi:hypothetical protein